ncbi:hypothetical protein Leryth_004796 [Lithospermum erythrorhizon]|nr:hypothetical protein Leryth_004796 [Lithospermum erythrorhizon]
MANLSTSMDASFWDLNIASPQKLDGVARSVPGEPIPLDGTIASRALRIQQISVLGNGFPLGIIPCYSPPPQKELGTLALHSLFIKAATSNWWLGLIGQFRPKKLISNLKAELCEGDEWELPAFKDVAKHFLDKSLFSLGLCSQIALTAKSSMLFSTEMQGEKKRRCYKAMLFHKLPEHDITMEAAWPELFLDHKGKYWEVPESVSLDCTSLVSESGFRYRFGLHKNTGLPQAHTYVEGEAPHGLMPGLCAKAAFSYEKSKDFWRQKEMKEEVMIQTDKGRIFRPSYDIRLREPHSAISGIIGGTCVAWLGGREPVESGKHRALGADIFGSACYTWQHGKFRKYFSDLTRIDARLDVSSLSALAKTISNSLVNSPKLNAGNFVSLPKLNLIFQQQVAGPIVFRMDSKISLASSSGLHGPQLEDMIYSLNYSLKLLQSGKVVAWYSPKRKEGMIELRLFEF